jgi:hypothetical protein
MQFDFDWPTLFIDTLDCKVRRIESDGCQITRAVVNLRASVGAQWIEIRGHRRRQRFAFISVANAM